MSRLRALRLQGFKSFAEPTQFVFEPGVTAVIGPNGSGKSNMADAIRWVLGEQSNRSLRTRRADDVIFGGSESRRPVGLAEVTLTLDNHDRWLPIEFGEVTVTRRAYRSGDPEYLVNGAKVRLRDVVELLAAGRLGANELVVVGQGTVDAALSLRPEDRRQLFEEAAGVKAFQVRRNEATARLNRAQDNLARVSDLVGELRPQVRRLALQAEHQEAHDRLGGQVRALVLEHHGRRERALHGSLGEARRRAAAVATELATEREAAAGGQRAVAEAEERYWAREAEARSAAAAWEAAREAVIRAEGRQQSLDERVRDMEQARLELEAAWAATVAVDAKGALGATDTNADASAAAAEVAWRDALGQARDADQALLDAEGSLATFRRAHADRLAATGRLEALTREKASLDGEIASAEATIAQATTTEQAARADLDTAQFTSSRTEAVATTAQAAAARATAAVVELEARTTRVVAELADLGVAADGAPELVERLRAAGWDPAPTGWGDTPAATAARALLGDLRRVLLWREGAEAELDATGGDVRLLRAGSGPIAGRDDALAAVGASQTLAEALGDPGGPEVVHRAVVATDVAALLAGWPRLPNGWVAVTLAGDVADARGVVILRGRAGGATLPVEPATRRAELVTIQRRLESELHGVASERGDALAALEHATATADAAGAALETTRIAAGAAADDLAAARRALERLQQRHAELDSEMGTLRRAVPAEGSAEPSVQREHERLEAVAIQARARRDAAAAEQEVARGRWQATVQATDARDAAAADRRAAAARLEERRAQLDAQQVRLDGEERALHDALEAASLSLVAARAAELAAGEARAVADDQRETERQALLEAERHMSGGAGPLLALEQQQQSVAIELSRLEEALVGLDRERALSLEGLPEAASDPDEPPAVDIGALTDDDVDDELRKSRRQLAQIGSVNPFAIEEHRELSARITDLTNQEADLRAAADATQALIGRLDVEIGQQFQAAFAAIGQRFDEYCRLLFAGGSASLELTDAEDSEAPGGIEIAVRPPGKRLQRLAMLSGGERALTGVALLFAMLSVNPVPFCVLDEVDAALDEANIGRFADALRRLAETIDFVVITHNRATIETADTIYGVTMTDAAVSRVLSLRLADVPVEVSA